MNENIKRAETTTVQCKIKKIYRSQDVVPFFFTLNFVSSVTWLECNPTFAKRLLQERSNCPVLVHS